MPPRMPKAALLPPRLRSLWEAAREHAVVLVEAPGGFGKSTLLLQWRRLWLGHGAHVGWLVLDANDDAPRLAQALLQALRVATGRRVFDTLAAQSAGQPGAELDALTSLLSAIAELATPTVLMLDDAERLPPATTEGALAYLLLNAPSNLQIVIASRTALPIATTDLLAHGALMALTVKDLRLHQDEAVAILTQRFGTGLSMDDRVRLHEITGGWPIGLQLAAASIEREPDLHAAVMSISARGGAIERYFLESLLERLPPELAQFLIRIAIFEVIEPQTCRFVTGCTHTADFIARLTAETPILVATERQHWLRMHPLARDFLLARFERLPQMEQHDLHRRASAWFAEHGRFAEAGQHALHAGDPALAQSFALRGLWDLGRAGRIAEAREWLDRIPPQALEANVSWQLMAAWALTIGDRAAEGQRMAKRVLDDPSLDPNERFRATLVAATGAVFNDQPGLLPSLMKDWPTVPAADRDPLDYVAHANLLSAMALYRGEHQEVRRIQANVKTVAEDESTRIAFGIGRLLVGLGHLQHGNVYRADAALQQPLIDAEQSSGRRGAMAAMYAAVLAATAYERDQIQAAEELLADRLDVVERTSMPDAILHAYRTLARVALAQGDERRALAALENLRTGAEARSMPRLTAASLADEVRIHAHADRPETATAALRHLEAMRPTFKRREYALLLPHYELAVALARTYRALASFDWAAAEQALVQAETFATRLQRDRERIQVMTLRAVVADARGHDGAAVLLKEASGLAALNGLARVIGDAHPRALRLRGGDPASGETIAAPTPAARGTAVQGGLLTPKEAEILGLLDANLPNKLIARTLDVSGDTVKWHLKNLFSKLNAASRRHAVDRARLLGLL